MNDWIQYRNFAGISFAIKRSTDPLQGKQFKRKQIEKIFIEGNAWIRTHFNTFEKKNPV